MELLEYRKEFLESVRIESASNDEGTVAAFVREAADILSDTGLLPDYETCFFVGVGKRNKRMRVDGYAFDDIDGTMYLLIADYDGSENGDILTLTNAKNVLERLTCFLDESAEGNLIKEIEVSTPAYDLVDLIKSNKDRIRKYYLMLLTDKIASERIETLSMGDINNIPVEYGIWDIGRIYRNCISDDEMEQLAINLCDYTPSGIPCLEASDAKTDEFRSFLCVIPGNFLADIYDKYGSRLLESNVRSFLSTKVAVNKKIRKTIITEPKHFFAYNNGIAATATKVVSDKLDKGLFIKEIHGLQIVNGGQTTASLSNARYKDKASLDLIYVQMKLTEIERPELAITVVPNISRSSNSQNKVSEADFFSNHSFHVRMQKISRNLYAPSIGGAQYETHWFYERARGQFIQAQARLSKKEKAQFLLRNPKSQVVTKTNLAQVVNLWEQLPYKVSYGVQKNFTVFADRIIEEWEKDEAGFNELYYKHVVALIIIFRYLEEFIPKQPWYNKGFRAQIIYYTIAKLSSIIQEEFKGKNLDLSEIWNRQTVPDILVHQLAIISKEVFDILTEKNRPIENVTEWSKKEICWSRIKDRYIEPAEGFESVLIGTDESRGQEKHARKSQRENSNIEAQIFVVSFDNIYWLDMLKWARQKNLVDDNEQSLLRLAGNKSHNKLPNEVQSRMIVRIRERMLSEGYNEH